MPTTSPPGSYRFFRHRDFGLLREGPEQLQFDMWQGDHWQAIIMNPFTASMAPVTAEAARELAGAAVHRRPTHQELPGGEVVAIAWPA